MRFPRTSSRAVIAFLAVCALSPGISRAETSSRVSLLAADTGHLYYSVDAIDPEASVSTIRRHCPGRVSGVPNGSQPCLSSAIPNPTDKNFTHSLFWMPGNVFDAPVTWSASQPFRFHLEIDVDTLAPYTIHLGIQKATELPESAAATEVAPGVFEGTLTAGSPLGKPGAVDLIFIRVRTPAPQIDLTMKAGGSSYVEPPQPVEARSVPELLAEHTYHPDPSSFSTPQRSFWFNDSQWEEASFQGDLTAARQFTMELPRRAEILVAWVEAFGTPFVQDVVRGGQPDPQKLITSPIIKLLRDGEQLEHGGNNGATGRGEDALSVTGLAAGPVTLDVAPPQQGPHSAPYTAHFLAVYGTRTLERMRWSFQVDHEGNAPAYRVANSGLCPGGYEVVPTTRETTTFSMDLDWDTDAVGDPGFTIRFSLPGVGAFPCGEMGIGDHMRLTIPGARVWAVGATPAPGNTFVSWHDTVFEMDVRYSYTKPPAS